MLRAGVPFRFQVLTGSLWASSYGHQVSVAVYGLRLGEGVGTMVGVKGSR